MNDSWSILYRGPLSSCNYTCDYCPFGKTRNTREELEDDRARLERFVDWVGSREETIGVLFTPWGEALIRRHYQAAFQRLSAFPNVRRVSAQTNLSCRLDWLAECDVSKVALWCTYHPTQTPRDRFIAHCETLRSLGVAHSVGVVAFKEAWDDIVALRDALPQSTYLWLNAYKRDPHYYDDEDIARFASIDPLFRLNTRYHTSRGEMCRAGFSTFTVDGDGQARRCHFIKEPLGSIYDEAFPTRLARRPCTNDTCGCHIGYVHMDRLELYEVFGEGVLERIPDPQFFRGRGMSFA